jgi:hypothetical protein
MQLEVEGAQERRELELRQCTFQPNVQPVEVAPPSPPAPFASMSQEGHSREAEHSVPELVIEDSPREVGFATSPEDSEKRMTTSVLQMLGAWKGAGANSFSPQLPANASKAWEANFSENLHPAPKSKHVQPVQAWMGSALPPDGYEGGHYYTENFHREPVNFAQSPQMHMAGMKNHRPDALTSEIQDLLQGWRGGWASPAMSQAGVPNAMGHW